MRKGLLGSIAALTAGAGAAWAQPPVGPGVAPVFPGPVAPGVAPPPPVGVPAFGGLPQSAIPGNSGYAPAPAILPPGNFGPPSDPLGMGPVGGFGPPPGPQFPVPGPYAQQSFQPAPPTPNVSDGAGLGYGSAPRWWVDGEYLLWFTKNQHIRYPLLTTSAPADAGILGASSTIVLSGNRDLGYNAMNGFRLSAGFFGDADRRFGFQMTGFATERRANAEDFGGLDQVSGIPTLARPFIDVNGLRSTLVLSGPEFGPAQARVATTNQTWGVEPVGVWNIYRAEPGSRAIWSVDLLAGYRFIQIKEELTVTTGTMLDPAAGLSTFTTNPFGIITQTTSSINPALSNLGGVTIVGPAFVAIRDSFRTTNQFNGFVLGLRSEGRYGIFTASSFAKVAVGDMHERIEIIGGSTFFDPSRRSGTLTNNINVLNTQAGGGVGGAYGGVLANAGNIGTYLRDRFTYVPEAGGNVGIALTRGLTGFIGFNFMYFPDVVRPGSLANPRLSSSSIPFSPGYGTTGAARGPALQIVQEEHWLGGINIGFQLRY